MEPIEFEEATGLSGYKAARLLRVNPPTYYTWRRGERPVPAYIQASMNAHVEAMARGWVPEKPIKQKGENP